MTAAYFVSTCALPYSIVEKEGFAVFCETLRHGYKPPGRKALTNNYVPKLYSTTRDGMLVMLKGAESVSLTSDAWTFKAQEPYISLTAHFIAEDWRLYAFTLCCRALPQDHTGLNIKEWFVEALQEWQIPQKKVTCFTTDNGDNIRLAVDLLQVSSMRCFGHTLQNGVSDILQMDEVKDLLVAAQKLQQFFSTQKIQNRYKSYMEKCSAAPRVLPAPVKTRWWSELPLLLVLEEDSAHLRGFLANYNSGKHLDLRLVDAQKNALLLLLATLGPLQDLCTELCGSKYVTASAVLPVLYLVENMATNSMDGFMMDLSQLPEVKPDGSMLKLLLLKLYKRYSPAGWETMHAETTRRPAQVRQCDRDGRHETHKLLVKCSYLDNRFREDLKAEDLKLAREQLLDEIKPAGGDVDSGTVQPPLKKKRNIAALFAKFSAPNTATEATADVSQRTLLKQEMNRYELISVEKDEVILPWWNVHQLHFPMLAKLARKYLAVPATSTESERLFSQAGLIITNLRTCLTGEHAEQLIFLSMNKEFVPKP